MNQTIVNPDRELRFRRTPLVDAAAEVWMPVFRGRQSEHDFLGYYQARPELADAREEAENGKHRSGHEVVAYARVRIEVLEMTAPPAEDS